jgi:hypothetical protein
VIPPFRRLPPRSVPPIPQPPLAGRLALRLLAEGEDKVLQCRLLKIDENDHFTRLLRTCQTETIGGVTVKEVISS